MPNLPPSFKTFSLRAECRYDLNKFEVNLCDAGFKCIAPKRVPMLLDNGTPDGVDVGEEALEFKTNATLEQLQQVLKSQDDSHVMVRTLRELPLDINFDRDPSRN